MPISRIGLGGHEFLPDGRSRGFNEDYARATTPGVIFPGFGGPVRLSVVREAHALGINLFDVTIDSEKEALARNLSVAPPPSDVLIQTRPEGMCWSNNPSDPDNQQMAEYPLLRAEVVRILSLTGWTSIGSLNLGFNGSALAVNPRYLDLIARNIGSLKAEGLIRYATADTFSGEETYLRQIDTGAFDAIFISLSFANDGGLRRVVPAAAAAGMAVFAREVYAKGELFGWGVEAGVTDRSLLARMSLKWVLAVPGVSSVVVGAGTPAELQSAVGVLGSPTMTAEEQNAFRTVSSAAGFLTYRVSRRTGFFGSSDPD
jgi:aryl-alcohol dehydrogenase-like predicted oxidoreductase